MAERAVRVLIGLLPLRAAVQRMVQGRKMGGSPLDRLGAIPEEDRQFDSAGSRFSCGNGVLHVA